MKSLNIKTFGLLAIGSIAFTSCINSQEAYEKAALSGFVASQTKDIVEKNKVDLTPVQKEIKSVDMKVEAIITGCKVHLDKFCDKCQSGPVLAQVETVKIKSINLKEFSIFKIIY